MSKVQQLLCLAVVGSAYFTYMTAAAPVALDLGSGMVPADDTTTTSTVPVDSGLEIGQDTGEEQNGPATEVDQSIGNTDSIDAEQVDDDATNDIIPAEAMADSVDESDVPANDIPADSVDESDVPADDIQAAAASSAEDLPVNDQLDEETVDQEAVDNEAEDTQIEDIVNTVKDAFPVDEAAALDEVEDSIGIDHVDEQDEDSVGDNDNDDEVDSEESNEEEEDDSNDSANEEDTDAEEEEESDQEEDEEMDVNDENLDNLDFDELVATATATVDRIDDLNAAEYIPPVTEFTNPTPAVDPFEPPVESVSTAADMAADTAANSSAVDAMSIDEAQPVVAENDSQMLTADVDSQDNMAAVSDTSNNSEPIRGTVDSSDAENSSKYTGAAGAVVATVTVLGVVSLMIMALFTAAGRRVRNRFLQGRSVVATTTTAKSGSNPPLASDGAPMGRTYVEVPGEEIEMSEEHWIA